jgi:hypothetical protein
MCMTLTAAGRECCQRSDDDHGRRPREDLSAVSDRMMIIYEEFRQFA